MFWNIFYALCESHGTTPNAVCKKLKLSNATATHWKNGTIPRGDILLNIADYFNCSVDYLLGRTNQSHVINENNYINEIEIGDASNREGHAAKVYFNALFGKDFTRTEENSINAALNYGYGIILSTFNREIVSNGYITQIGLFHDNMFNQFNLGSDLMEPFRPLVDYIVRSLMPQKFEREEKLEILRILQQEVTIAGRREVVNNAIKIYCKSVFDALNEDDTSLIKFYKDEL